MDPCERHLLQHMVLLEDKDIVRHALATKQCIIASDGSAPALKGSFAWNISDTHGKRLAQCCGPVYGYRISSYRAEGYGILSSQHEQHPSTRTDRMGQRQREYAKEDQDHGRLHRTLLKHNHGVRLGRTGGDTHNKTRNPDTCHLQPHREPLR